MQSKSQKPPAPSSSSKGIPDLLARLQQCSGTEQKNAFVILKRLAAAAESQPQLRCTAPPHVPSFPSHISALSSDTPPLQPRQRLLLGPRPDCQAPSTAHQEVRACTRPSQRAAGPRSAQGAAGRGAVPALLHSHPVLLFRRPARVEGGQRSGIL
jgi:hypothetical protein